MYNYLEELYNQKPNYIKNFILKKVAIILKNKNSHSLKSQLYNYMNTKEFKFVKYCIDSDFKAIKKYILEKSLKQKLQYLSLEVIFTDLSKEYANYLISGLKINIIDNSNIYKNNLLDDRDITQFYKEIEDLISLIEKKIHTQEIDNLLIDKLGNINNKNSNWHINKVPLDLQDRYKRIKGIFEFQRFMTIAKYLAPSLEMSNANEYTNDAKRLTNRSLFWSNYDERFSSVQMWLSIEDYEDIRYNRIVSVDNIKILEDINSEACLLEFQDKELSILVFFRSRDDKNRENLKSLIFEKDNMKRAKEILREKSFSFQIYIELRKLADFKLTESPLWAGWVDKFLRGEKIYPNKLILNRKEKFKITPTIRPFYSSYGLEDTRKRGIEKCIKYEDVIKRI